MAPVDLMPRSSARIRELQARQARLSVDQFEDVFTEVAESLANEQGLKGPDPLAALEKKHCQA